MMTVRAELAYLTQHGGSREPWEWKNGSATGDPEPENPRASPHLLERVG